MQQLQRQLGNQALASLLVDFKGPAASRELPGTSKDAPTDDSDLYSEFDAEYNKYAGKFAYLSQRQVLAIGEVYTEAKKPAKPSLIDELLVAAAIASLGMTVSILGQSLERALLPKLSSELQDLHLEKYWSSESRNIERVDEAIQNAKSSAALEAQIVAKAANDAFKDGTKSLVQPRVKQLLAEGATPVDAFFQGQMDAMVEMEGRKFDAAEDLRPEVWRLHHLHPRLPHAVAAALFRAADEAFRAARAVQARQTLDEWLAYTTQAYQAKWEGKKHRTEG